MKRNHAYLVCGWLLLVAGCAAGPSGPPVFESADAARAALQSSDADERIYALEYLGDSQDPASIVPIAAKLNDEDKWVRLSAVMALQNLNTPLAVPHLREALRDSDADVRFSAASALFELEDFSGESVLIEALSSNRSEFRFQALMFLGRMRSQAAFTGIIGMLKDQDPRTRSTAAYLLGLYRERSAVPALIDALADENSWVRRDAWAALKVISGKDLEFSYDGDAALRARQADRWKKWWAREAGVAAAADVGPTPTGGETRGQTINPDGAGATGAAEDKE